MGFHCSKQLPNHPTIKLGCLNPPIIGNPETTVRFPAWDFPVDLENSLKFPAPPIEGKVFVSLDDIPNVFPQIDPVIIIV